MSRGLCSLKSVHKRNVYLWSLTILKTFLKVRLNDSSISITTCAIIDHSAQRTTLPSNVSLKPRAPYYRTAGYWRTIEIYYTPTIIKLISYGPKGKFHALTWHFDILIQIISIQLPTWRTQLHSLEFLQQNFMFLTLLVVCIDVFLLEKKARMNISQLSSSRSSSRETKCHKWLNVEAPIDNTQYNII